MAPACIHTKRSLPSVPLEAIGWGTTDFYGDASPHLLKVFLNVIEPKECKRIYSNTVGRRLSKGILDESQVCAGDLSGKDTCPVSHSR